MASPRVQGRWCAWVRYRPGVLAGELVFVPDQVPRQGRFALWGTGQGSDEVALVLPGGASGVRRRRVRARLLTVAEALPLLMTIHPAAGASGARGDPGMAPEEVSRSVAAWAVAASAGVGLVARGRLLPTVGPGGADVWRAGPLDPADLAWLQELGCAFPAVAHALPMDGSRPLRVHSPQWLVRACWDAIADTLVRTAAAPRTVASSAFAAADVTRVDDLAGWLADVTGGLAAGARLGVRIEAVDMDPAMDAGDAGGLAGAGAPGDSPAGARSGDGEPPSPAGSAPAEPCMRAVLQLRSSADPSLVVDAADLWDQPEAVLARFGVQAETDLLLALRRGAAVWSPLQAALRQADPVAVELDDDAIDSLLGPAAEDLAGVGIEVLWPASLVNDGLLVKAEAVPAPGQLTEAGFSLPALLAFRWQVTLGGELLDPDEVAALAEAKRPLVRLRGRWVALDPTLLERLRRPPRATMTALEALGAALAGAAEIDGDLVEVVACGSLLGLVQRLSQVSASPPSLDPPPGLLATLRPYQQRGVSWLNAMCDLGLGGCLADDMGLGKTIQVIALHLHRRTAEPAPTLVVCPASLLGTWEREVRRFAPDLPVRRYHGGDRHLVDVAEDEIVLVTYGVVLRDRAELAGIDWGLVVADEAQHAKNPLSRTARELRRLPAPARIALTGTPVENRLSELWSILDWTTPGLLGELEPFTRRVAVPVERYRDPEATRRFADLVRPFLLRRRKSDPGIAPELPPKTETDRIVALTGEQVTLYEAVVRQALAEIATRDGIERAGLVFKLLTALKQICNHPAQYLKQAGPLAGRSGKLAAFDELTDVILSGGESMLVFTQYTAMATLLQQHLDSRGVRSLFLHGKVPVRRREEMVEEFQAGRAPVFLLSLKAGGTGLTLTRATQVLHYDRWWNPAVEDQASDRAYRIGQDRPVQVHRLVTEGTLEDRIAALLEKKRELAEAVVGTGEGWIAELSDDQLGELVSLRAAT